jgi:hypothetical protein
MLDTGYPGLHLGQDPQTSSIQDHVIFPMTFIMALELQENNFMQLKDEACGTAIIKRKPGTGNFHPGKSGDKIKPLPK